MHAKQAGYGIDNVRQRKFSIHSGWHGYRQSDELVHGALRHVTTEGDN
jgi:hypothetical protein